MSIIASTHLLTLGGFLVAVLNCCDMSCRQTANVEPDKLIQCMLIFMTFVQSWEKAIYTMLKCIMLIFDLGKVILLCQNVEHSCLPPARLVWEGSYYSVAGPSSLPVLFLSPILGGKDDL